MTHAPWTGGGLPATGKVHGFPDTPPDPAPWDGPCVARTATLHSAKDPVLAQRLDVLIPHFRDPDGLARSLSSVAAQDWEGALRVIVVDDASGDADFAAAAAVCDNWRQTTGRALLIDRNAHNLGRPRTRNRLIDMSDAACLAWLDAGDIWYPEKLSRQFAHMTDLAQQGTDPNRVWVSCAYDWQDAGQSAARHLRQQIGGDQIRNLLLGESLRAYLWTLLGTRDSFVATGYFDERLSRLQDLDYFLRFARSGGRITVPPQDAPLCRYFKSHIGRNAAEVHACYRLIVEKHRPALNRYPRAFTRRLTYKVEWLAARFAEANGQTGRRLRHLARAALASPRRALRDYLGPRARPAAKT